VVSQEVGKNFVEDQWGRFSKEYGHLMQLRGGVLFTHGKAREIEFSSVVMAVRGGGN